MEPPPICSVWLENEDGGLLNSTSSKSASRCQLAAKLPESDAGGKPDGTCSESLVNTLARDCCDAKHLVAIEPPPQFQDGPLQNETTASVAGHESPSENKAALVWLEKFASRLASGICDEALAASHRSEWSTRRPEDRPRRRRPPGWLSSSHGSLTASRADDSSFITSAVSAGEIADVYAVPFDSDVYAVPVDVVRPAAPQRPRRQQRHHHRKRRRHAQPEGDQPGRGVKGDAPGRRPASPDTSSDPGNKRRGAPGSSAGRPEPIHMTLQEVRRYLHNLYSSSSDSSEHRPRREAPTIKHVNGNDQPAKSINGNLVTTTTNNNNVRKHKKNTLVINIKNKKAKDACEIQGKDDAGVDFDNERDKLKKSTSGRLGFSSNLKQTLCNMFRIRKPPSPERIERGGGAVVLRAVEELHNDALIETKAPFLRRALPPLPSNPTGGGPVEGDAPDGPPEEEPSMDFASSIEKVKDYGWYWGPTSGEVAEKILSNEPDGSFIVRDSSDDHYIFSLTFKLNACIRHVRIEHDQGNFSFGSCTKFKSHTIVDFIENAVEHSRSGRYLFFLHRRPVLGPMRVQLLHPVSRFKQVQSLQHMCRFVILKLVRKDLICTLPLPRRVIDYLSTPHYYSEQLVEGEEEEEEDSGSDGAPPSPNRVVHVLSFVPQGLS